MYHVQVEVPHSLFRIPTTLARHHACSALYVVGETWAKCVLHGIETKFNTQDEE